MATQTTQTSQTSQYAVIVGGYVLSWHDSPELARLALYRYLAACQRDGYTPASEPSVMRLAGAASYDRMAFTAI